MKGFKGQNDVEGFVYLLHFDRPYKHAAHYVGWTSQLGERIDDHRKGFGSRLMAVIKEAGIGFSIARVWRNKTHAFEKYVKNEQARRFCPVCSEKPVGVNMKDCLSEDEVKKELDKTAVEMVA